MSSPQVLDVERLVTALEGDSPVGADLRDDSSPRSPFYAVKDARGAARAAERQLMAEGDQSASPPDWRPVLENGVKVLTEKSKDLEVAAYLIEALARLHGFAGLRDGFRVVRELVERFWDGLYPLPDEDGLETKVAPLTGLNGADSEGTLINPITRVPLTQGQSQGPFAYYHYQQAQIVQQIADEAVRQTRINSGAVSIEMIERAVAETPAVFFGELMADLNECLDEFARLSSALEEKCGSHSPPTSSIRTTLESCRDAVQFIARDKLQVAAVATEATSEANANTPAAAADSDVPGVALGAIRNREGAFQTLLKVADFFRRSEPHSPVSYALEQAVRWGRMSLPELLTELIPDEGFRNGFFKQVGIRGQDKSEG